MRMKTPRAYEPTTRKGSTVLLKIAFRVALVAGAAYATKKVLDRTGATEKIVAAGAQALESGRELIANTIERVVDAIGDGLSQFADDESEDAMTTPQAAAWNAARDKADAPTEPVGGAGGRW